MATYATRRSTEHAIFGQPATLPTNQLPSCADVVKLYLFYQKQQNEVFTIHDYATRISKEVKDLYDKACIPTIKLSSIIQKVKRLVEKMQELGKYAEKKRTLETFQSKVNLFDTLFDVCSCRCFDAGVRERSSCSCPLPLKVPQIEWQFWVDQKTCKKMVIGSVDKIETAKVMNRVKRLRKSYSGTLKPYDCVTNEEQDRQDLSVDSGDDFNEIHDGDDDPDYCEYNDNTKHGTSSEDEAESSQNRTTYPELCKAIERSKVSNRQACIIANALLKDLKLLTPQTIIDPAKIQRQRRYWRKREIAAHTEVNKNLKCIGFDGKKDDTLVAERHQLKNIKQEHYVVLSYPGNIYIDHVVPQTSKATDVAKEIACVINETDSEESLQAVLCDGTNVNTGRNNGIIRKLELHLGKPLQWLVCMLHTNELPFRKYFSVIDEAITTGPNTSSGTISDELNFDPQDIPLVNFSHLSGKVKEVIDEVTNNLTSDQLYFLRACLAVQGGSSSCQYLQFLQQSSPGKLNHARWLTKANRVLRLYMSKPTPSEALKKIVSFILNVYGPTWFHIKKNSSCQEGAKNFFFLLQLCQQLPHEDKNIVLPVLQNNSYFCHPENILIAAIADNNVNIRQQAAQHIIIARQIAVDNVIRVFDKNKIIINFDADTYFNMIDWSNCDVTSPPLLSCLSNEDVNGDQPVLFTQFPCHSQSVERVVKDLSECCLQVAGHDARHGTLLLTKKSRLELPKVDSKSDFL